MGSNPRPSTTVAGDFKTLYFGMAAKGHWGGYTEGEWVVVLFENRVPLTSGVFGACQCFPLTGRALTKRRRLASGTRFKRDHYPRSDGRLGHTRPDDSAQIFEVTQSGREKNDPAPAGTESFEERVKGLEPSTFTVARPTPTVGPTASRQPLTIAPNNPRSKCAANSRANPSSSITELLQRWHRLPEEMRKAILVLARVQQ